MGVWHTAPGLNLDVINMAPSNYFIYREQNRVFQDIGLYQGDSVAVTRQGNPEQVQALDVTDGVLPILGVTPMLGRWFNRADVAPNAADTVMLDYGYWQRRFGSDRAIVGRTITVDGKARQVIGVMPQHFRFLDGEQPAAVSAAATRSEQNDAGAVQLMKVIARLQPGVTLAAANTDIARMIPTVWTSFPAPPGFSIDLFHKAQLGPKVRPLSQDGGGRCRQAAVGADGIDRCSSADCLRERRQPASGSRRRTASANWPCVRRWVRAGGGLSSDFLLESVVIGALGSALGLGLAFGALRLLIAIAPQGLPRLQDIGIDWTVLAFTVGVSLFCSLLFGSIPALRYASARGWALDCARADAV